jgi:hypothetical protein
MAIHFLDITLVSGFFPLDAVACNCQDSAFELPSADISRFGSRTSVLFSYLPLPLKSLDQFLESSPPQKVGMDNNLPEYPWALHVLRLQYFSGVLVSLSVHLSFFWRTTPKRLVSLAGCPA